MNDAARDDAYKYNGKEWDETMGLYDYGARWYDPVLGRWGQVDPLGSDFGAWSPFSYSFNNPIRFIDPDGRAPEDFVILIARDGAGGNGHMAAVIQDGKGNYYYATMGATEGGGSQMLSGVQGGMSLSSLTGAKSMDEAVGMAKLDGNNSQYTDEVRFETTPEMDQKIFNEVSEMQEDVNSGKVEYNVVSMNCTDAVEKPIERATGADFPDDIVPNKNFENVKSSRSRIQAQINLEQGTHEVKFVPSGLDNYPSSTRPVIILKEKPRDNN